MLSTSTASSSLLSAHFSLKAQATAAAMITVHRWMPHAAWHRLNLRYLEGTFDPDHQAGSGRNVSGVPRPLPTRAEVGRHGGLPGVGYESGVTGYCIVVP